MTFNDQIRSLSNQEIADIFQFAGIEAKKFYKDRIAYAPALSAAQNVTKRRDAHFILTLFVSNACMLVMAVTRYTIL